MVFFETNETSFVSAAFFLKMKKLRKFFDEVIDDTSIGRNIYSENNIYMQKINTLLKIFKNTLLKIFKNTRIFRFLNTTPKSIIKTFLLLFFVKSHAIFIILKLKKLYL